MALAKREYYQNVSINANCSRREESYGIGVVEVLRSGQALDARVSVAGRLVGGALDLRQVGNLVDGGGGLHFCQQNPDRASQQKRTWSWAWQVRDSAVMVKKVGQLTM